MSLNGSAESYVEVRGSMSIPEAIHGKSAYEIAVEHGFNGTEKEWVSYISANAKRAEEAANKATKAAEAEVARLVGEIGIAQSLGESATKTVSQRVITDNFNKHNKQLTNLEKGIGQDPFETDDSVAYAKIVPEDALPYAEVSKIGGMSYRDEATGTLKNAVVTSIKSVGKNLIPFPYYSESGTSSGITFTVNENGSITIKGTCNADTSFALFVGKLPLLGSVKLSGISNGSIGTYYLQPYFNEKAGSALYNGFYNYADDLSKSGLTRLMLFVKTGAVIDETITPILSYTSLGNIPYEPYKESILPIPSEVQALEGYGLGVTKKYTNHIDFENRTWNRMVKRSVKVDGGQVVPYTTGNGKGIYITLGSVSEADFISGSRPILCNKYPSVTADDTYNGVTGCGINSFKAITFYDPELQTADAWKAKIKEWNDAGEPLEFIYAIKTPIVTDISDLITNDNFIEVSEGGLVIAENENGLDVPTTITYQTPNRTGDNIPNGDEVSY